MSDHLQILYLIYTFADNLRVGGSDNKISEKAKNLVFIAYIFHVIGTYLILYLSRTREYYADHFAAEITGNPNGLSRALVKIAYGILEIGEKEEKPSKLIQGTRALGIYDPKAASSTGTAYRTATEPQKVGKVFLWDMFNRYIILTQIYSNLINLKRFKDYFLLRLGESAPSYPQALTD